MFSRRSQGDGVNVLLLLLLLPHRLSNHHAASLTHPSLSSSTSLPAPPPISSPPPSTDYKRRECQWTPPPTYPKKKKKKGKRCVPPVLRSPRPDPHTIHSSGLNNASAATDLKGSQEQFSTRNNTSLTVTMETNDSPGWLGGGGLEEGGKNGEMEREGRVK